MATPAAAPCQAAAPATLGSPSTAPTDATLGGPSTTAATSADIYALLRRVARGGADGTAPTTLLAVSSVTQNVGLERLSRLFGRLFYHPSGVVRARKASENRYFGETAPRANDIVKLLASMSLGAELRDPLSLRSLEDIDAGREAPTFAGLRPLGALQLLTAQATHMREPLFAAASGAVEPRSAGYSQRQHHRAYVAAKQLLEHMTILARTRPALELMAPLVKRAMAEEKLQGALELMRGLVHAMGSRANATLGAPSAVATTAVAPATPDVPSTAASTTTTTAAAAATPVAAPSTATATPVAAPSTAASTTATAATLGVPSTAAVQAAVERVRVGGKRPRADLCAATAATTTTTSAPAATLGAPSSAPAADEASKRLRLTVSQVFSMIETATGGPSAAVLSAPAAPAVLDAVQPAAAPQCEADDRDIEMDELLGFSVPGEHAAPALVRAPTPPPAALPPPRAPPRPLYNTGAAGGAGGSGGDQSSGGARLMTSAQSVSSLARSATVTAATVEVLRATAGRQGDDLQQVLRNTAWLKRQHEEGAAAALAKQAREHAEELDRVRAAATAAEARHVASAQAAAAAAAAATATQLRVLQEMAQAAQAQAQAAQAETTAARAAQAELAELLGAAQAECADLKAALKAERANSSVPNVAAMAELSRQHLAALADIKRLSDEHIGLRAEIGRLHEMVERGRALFLGAPAQQPSVAVARHNPAVARGVLAQAEHRLCELEANVDALLDGMLPQCQQHGDAAEGESPHFSQQYRAPVQPPYDALV